MPHRQGFILLFMLGIMFFVAAPLFAHGTGSHVMGTATAVEVDHLGVKTKEGKDVTILVTPKTQFRRSGPAGASPSVQVGDRVVVEVTEDGKEFTATEVRFSTPQPKK